jgi:uncharacterized protein (DUF302 family)
MSQLTDPRALWRFLILILFTIPVAYGQQTSQGATEEIPAHILEELTPKPELGHRLMEELSEEAQAVRRKQLMQSSRRPMPNIPRELKQHMFNVMASVSGMSMRELFNFMAHKVKVNEGVTFDEVIESMEIKANEVNFKKVGQSNLWQDIGAISGLPALRLEILHFCDAIVGRRMLDYSPEFSIFIPCRISVIEDATGEIWIMTMDWDVSWLSMAWHPDSQLPEDLKQDARRIRDAMEAIMQAGASGGW